MSLKRKAIKILKIIMVICYILAFGSASRYQLELITFTRCIHDMVINALVIIFNWLTIEVLSSYRNHREDKEVKE